MKKILAIATVCVFAALSSKAASMSWQFTGASTDNGKTVYVVLNCTVDANTTYADFTSGKAGEIIGQGTIGKKGANYMAGGTAESDNLTSANANYCYVILDTSTSGSEKFWKSSVVDGSSKVFSGAESSPGSSSLTDKAAKTYTGFKAVPEPTTVALLALGLAALGLKRKVA